jgi:hypothetical protein
LDDLNQAQAEHLRHLGEVWPAYGHALQVVAATSGGMGWKTVKGVEYLVRYVHEAGKKKFTSYGRRSEETEATYRNFEETTLRARRIVKEGRDDVALTCRLAKAHGLARMPGRQAETLEWFWYTDVTRRLSLFGGSALFAYEAAAGAMAPPPATKEDRLMFVARTSDVGMLKLAEIEEACDVDRTGCVSRRKRNSILIETTGGEPRAEILLPEFLLERADDGTFVSEALDLPPYRGLTVARDVRPVELTTVDPRAYAVFARCLREDDAVWSERGQLAAEMAERIDGLRFAIHNLCEV